MADSQTVAVHDEQKHPTNGDMLLQDPSSTAMHATDALPPQLPPNILQIIEHELNTQNTPTLADIQAYPMPVYLNHTVIPIIIEALAVLDRERPKKPIEYLAAFLIKNRERFGERF